MIHVCYALSDRDGHYSKFTGTSICSLFENLGNPAPPHCVTIHLLHDNTLTDENLDRFSRFVERYNQQIKFYNVEHLCVDELAALDPRIAVSRFTWATCFRLFIPKVIPLDVKRLIYLDSDTVVNRNVSDLNDIDLGDKIFGVLPLGHIQSLVDDIAAYRKHRAQLFDYPYENKPIDDKVTRFNAGILLINMDMYREQFPELKRVWEFVMGLGHSTDDQSMLSIAFANNVLELSMDFNFPPGFGRRTGDVSIERRLIHYVMSNHGSHIGYGLDLRDNFNWVFFKYFMKTPWFNEETISNIYLTMRDIYNGQRNTALRLVKLLASKKRAFYVVPKDVNNVKKNLGVRNDEEVILAESDGDVDKVVNSVKESNGTKLFFVGAADYGSTSRQYAKIKGMLTKKGLKEWQDFVNAEWLFGDHLGVPFDTYPIIKNM